MAGLIQQSMGGAPSGAPAQQQDPMAGMPQSEMSEGAEGEAADQDNPTFKSAVAYAMQVLYEQQAAKDVSQSLKSAQSVSKGMADVAYDISSIVDEKTQGQVPDELLMLLGMKILEEVADIAEASGLKPSNQDVAEAFKQMLLRFLQDQGMDTTKLQQAMDQIDPSVYDQPANI